MCCNVNLLLHPSCLQARLHICLNFCRLAHAHHQLAVHQILPARHRNHHRLSMDCYSNTSNIAAGRPHQAQRHSRDHQAVERPSQARPGDHGHAHVHSSHTFRRLGVLHRHVEARTNSHKNLQPPGAGVASKAFCIGCNCLGTIVLAGIPFMPLWACCNHLFSDGQA